MSDRGFGDYSNRNVVKNPLLSSAVTGLSIEDLTQNAILLPAIPSQELNVRQDQNTETPTRPMRDSDNDTANLPSGDANINIAHIEAPPNINQNVLDANEQNSTSNIPNSTLPSASTKSDDDFDVNEYFARLQGTRYVSAPLNSNIKEDRGANLQAEDNLEEVNLNEPDNAQSVSGADVQQSITADIAQNFSQLPTVLPQVANAVLSSFSNMLHMKVKDRTQNDRNYNQPQGSSNVEFSVPETPVQVAPPPLKEYQPFGAPNYRITTKKKVYAQVPGLRSGDSHVHSNTPMNQSALPYFTANANVHTSNVPDVSSEIRNVSTGFGKLHSVLTPQNIQGSRNAHNPKGIDETKPFNEMNPIAVENKSDTVKQSSDVLLSHDSGTRTTIKQESIQSTTLQPIVTQQISQSLTPNIPPPPQFSNLSRRDSQASIGKSVLPPSVARRISANQPVLKRQTPPSIRHENIFVPTMPIEPNVLPSQLDPTLNHQNSEHDRRDQQEVDSKANTLLPQTSMQNSNFANDETILGATVPIQVEECKESMITTNSLITSQKPKHIDTFVSPSIFNVPTEPFSYPESTASSSFHTRQSDFDTSFKKEENRDISTVSHNTLSEHFGNLQPEPQKPIQEPPKLPGRLNYRMSKKKPQYYSGPIEGVGTISNNIKPVFEPVAANSFQGPIFTPDQSTGIAPNTYNTMFPDDHAINSSQQPSLFDISNSNNTETFSTFEPQTQSEQIQADYNTAFDLSRPTTEKYEEPQKESRDFGIFKSFKLKFGSLDINKLQNTVTTFFDPGYNSTDSSKQENEPYSYQNVSLSYNSNPQSDEATLEIFVPTINQEQATFNPYSYQMGQAQPINQTNKCNPTHDHYGNQSQSQATSSNYYSGWYDSNNQQQSQHISHGIVETENQVALDSTTKSFFDNPNLDLQCDVNRRTDPNESNELTKEECSEIDDSHVRYESECISDVSKISQVFTDPPSKGFFDKETSIVLPFAIKKPDESNVDNSSVNVQPNNTGLNAIVPEINTVNDNVPHIPKCFGETSQKDTANLADKFMNKKKGFKTLAELVEIYKQESEAVDFSDIYYSPISSEEISEGNVSTFSLFEQSPIVLSEPLLSNPLPEADVKLVETNMEKVSLFENDNTDMTSPPSYNLSGNKGSNESINDLHDSQVSDMNISEISKEDNNSQDTDEDLDYSSSHLMGRITILPPARPPPPLRDRIESPDPEPDAAQAPFQFHIPHNFIEFENEPVAIIENPDQPNDNITLPLKELVNDIIRNNHCFSFAWPVIDANSSTSQSDFNIDMGMHQNSSLFSENVPTESCDETKSVDENSQEDVSAPPEDDTTSDQSGLDVHSIGFDTGFISPFDKDYVIEPYETEDQIIESRLKERWTGNYKGFEEEELFDSFTNRVERFKQMENVTESNDTTQEIPQEMNSLDLPTSTSPPLTLASYFDTGNYAVETHYKNTITSPSTVSTTKQMRIPPGFEEEYSRRLSGVSCQDLACSLNNQTTSIPETSKNILSHTSDYEVICDSKVESMVEKLIDDENASTQSVEVSITNTTPNLENYEDNELNTQASTASCFNISPEEKNVESLPDPINFFSSNEERTEESEAHSDHTRLSSYFKTPPKSDNSKSFFELSESQNHYRHKSTERVQSIQSNVENFFETTNSANSTHIPQNNLATMALIRELTSPENITPNEDIVKTVNYFTVEYNFNNTIKINTVEPINIDKKDTMAFKHKTLHLVNDTNIFDRLDYKVKKNMDSNSQSNKDSKSMDTKSENVGKKSMTVNFCEQKFQDESDDSIVVMSENRASPDHAPLKHHWFYQVDSEERSFWKGFSVVDSRALENAFNSPDLNENTLVATDGGRYDVNLINRLKMAVYWDEKPANVMRCSWFYKGTTDARYIPYAESIAERLEEEYIHGVTTGEWHRRLLLPNNELVVMHGPAVMVHFLQNIANDAFSSSPLFPFGKRVYRNPPKIKNPSDQPKQIDHLVFLVHGAGEYRNQKNKIQSMVRPRVVRRGYVEAEIEDAEPSSIDHLLLLCHGVGSACDMRFRPVEEVVDDFRATSLQLIQSHYKNSYDSGLVGRVEVLPISWHSSLHSGQTGVDKRLAAVTLESIPRLRNFTNDTILDVLFYTSPVFCQTIIDTVCSELNRIYSLFKSRNPDFKGGVSLGGHSLGSVILYDLLCHQMPKDVPPRKGDQFVTGPAGTGQPSVKYPSLDFVPDAMYALGSPIAMFNCIRGIESLGKEFRFPTCKNFFNIFHPYDPIAYRIEPMINPQLRDIKPFLIPHHKGRKRMHLELKDTMARVGADIKQKLIESIRNTWSSMWKTQPPPDQHLEKVVEEEMEKEELNTEPKEDADHEREVTPDMLGQLNDGRRVDYVLQEAPFEMINEYLFAMRSHVCYWESEDTMLVMLREIYNALGVAPDCSLPQQTMTVQRSKTILDENEFVTRSDYPSTSRGSL